MVSKLPLIQCLVTRSKMEKQKAVIYYLFIAYEENSKEKIIAKRSKFCSINKIIDACKERSKFVLKNQQRILLTNLLTKIESKT